MRSYADPKKDRKARARSSSEKHDNKPAVQTADNRAETVVQQKIQNTISNSPRAMQLKAIQKAAGTAREQQAAQLQAMAQQHAVSRYQQKGNPEPKTIQKKENKTGMPDALKTGMENISGMDMSDVKVHYNSPKPAQLQAHAYARGTDIHLAPGQEKHLPHEAWHVVQQKQGRVQPTTQLKGTQINDDSNLEKEADSKGQAALEAVSGSQTVIMQAKAISGDGIVQRKWVEEDKKGMQRWDQVIDGVVWYATGPEEMWYKIVAPKKIKKESLESYKSYEGQKKTYEQWKLLKLGEALGGKVDDDNSTIDVVDDFISSITSPIGELIGYEGISGVSDSLLGRSVKTGTGGKDDISSRDKKTATRMGGVADTITGLTGLTAFVKGFKDATDPDKDLDERFVAFLNYEQGAMSIGESVSKLTATGTGSDLASKFGSGFEGFAAGFGAIKDAFLAMKKLIDFVKEQDLSDSEKAKAKAEIMLHIFELAKGVALSVKSFYEMATGSASGKLMAMVPGASIAVSALKMLMQGYYAFQSWKSWILMMDQMPHVEASIMQANKDKNLKPGMVDEASEFYRKNDALISNKQALIKEDKEEIEKIDKKDKKTDKDEERKKKRQERIKKLTEEIEELKDSKHEESDLSKDDVAEYTLVKELKSGNIKRVRRQTVHISAEMARIVADVMILSGIGGIAGGVTKGVAGSVELALPMVRLAKQAGRNRAGRDEAKGESTKYTKAFDSSKSDAAKKNFRLEQVRTLLKMAVKLADKDPKKAKKDYAKLKLYLTATGVNLDTLFKDNGKPGKQITTLFKAISEREFI